MKIFRSILIVVILVAGWFSAARPALAANFCFCAPDVKKLEAGGQQEPQCIPFGNLHTCTPQEAGLDSNLYQCKELDTEAQCAAAKTEWVATLKSEQKYNSFVGVIIPSCLLDPTLSTRCRDINVFLIALIELGKYLFSIIGALALAVFIYGRFLLILSAGNPEKVKKGTDSMRAAVIGLVVAFGGYLLIRFLGEAVGIRELYQLK